MADRSITRIGDHQTKDMIRLWMQNTIFWRSVMLCPVDSGALCWSTVQSLPVTFRRSVFGSKERWSPSTLRMEGVLSFPKGSASLLCSFVSLTNFQKKVRFYFLIFVGKINQTKMMSSSLSLTTQPCSEQDWLSASSWVGRHTRL